MKTKQGPNVFELFSYFWIKTLLYCEFAVIMSLCCFIDMNKTLKTARSYFISQIGFTSFEPAINKSA